MRALNRALNRAAVTDAIVFWETGRLGYNGVLAAVLIGAAMATDGWLGIGVRFAQVIALGALANGLYCAAYPLDLLAQATPWRQAWRRYRWIVWAVGTLLAAVLAGLASLLFPLGMHLPD